MLCHICILNLYTINTKKYLLNLKNIKNYLTKLINFLPQFKGVIVKDGTELYIKYGCFLSQCISHIQRYLKGIYDFVKYEVPKNFRYSLLNIII